MNNFLTKAPFLRITMALSAGIVIYSFCGFYWGIVTLFPLSILCMAVPFFVKSTKNIFRFEWAFGAGLLLAIVVAGYVRMHEVSIIPNFDNHKKFDYYEVEIKSPPSEKQNSVLVYADLIRGVDTVFSNAKVVLYFGKDSSALNLKSGDIVCVATLLSLPKTRGNPEEFDYGDYLKRKGICASGYVRQNNWTKISSNKSFSLIRLAQNCRIALLNIYKRMNITEDEFGIVAALTLGYKDALTPEIRESFSTTGASHILSVSGLHVGVVYLVLNFLLSFADNKKRLKRLKPCFIIIFLWFYAFITGLSPSVCRAALMFSMFLGAELLGRKPFLYNTIFASAFILLVINPLWLFDVGFQLSYSALLAIIYFQPKFYKLFHFKNRVLDFIWALTTVSFAAQLGAAPMCLYYFHAFPTFFLLSNYVGVPLSSVIIYNAVVLFVVHKISFVGNIAALSLKYITKFLHICLQFIENLQYSVFYQWISLEQLILMIVAVLMFGFVLHKPKFTYYAAMLLSLILCLSISLFNKIESNKIDELVVFGEQRNITINFGNGAENVVFTLDSTKANRIAANYWIRTNRAEAKYNLMDSLGSMEAFVWQNRSFALLLNNNLSKYYSQYPLCLDYLIVTGEVYPSEKLFKYFFKPKNLIVAADMFATNREKFRQLAEQHNINFYSIQQSGAFVLTRNEIQSYTPLSE